MSSNDSSHTSVAVAGATGDLGGRVVACLLKRGIAVTALVRIGSDSGRLAELQKPNVKVVEVDLDDEAAVTRAVRGAVCVVSCLVGLRNVILDTQTSLLNGSIAAGVPRFIPSDFSMDFTRLPVGSNRNLDNRRLFHAVLAQSSIQWTSILNGVFASVLGFPYSPLLLVSSRQVPYVENGVQQVSITAVDDVANYTAAAALDPSAPRYLRIAGCSVSSRELQHLASEMWGEEFELLNRGTLAAVKDAIAKEQTMEGEEGSRQLYPMSQILQYSWSMFSGLGNPMPLDNARYPDVQWTGINDVLEQIKQSSK